MRSRTVIFISDGTGITAETLGNGLLSQFEGIDFQHVRLPFIDTLEKAEQCKARIAAIALEDKGRPLVIMTMTNTEIAAALRRSDALILDLFEAFIAPLEQELGAHSTHTSGRLHGHSAREYASRIEAMNFTLAHDDGISSAKLKQADVILVGVSRSGKTPTCLYLSMQFGLKAANYPLIPEDFERGRLPDTLLPYRDKLFGLTIAPEQLQRIRQERKPNSRYAALENCRHEVASAESLMDKNNIAYFDMTARSIEEIAVQLLQAVKREA